MTRAATHCKLLIAKVGSSTLVDQTTGAPDTAFIHSLIAQIARLVQEGWQVVFVSSGAAAAGMGRLGFDQRPSDLPSLQACCAAGQAALTEIYAAELAAHGIPCGQVLLTRSDVANRSSYLNARNTFERLLELGAVPIVNENDTVSSTEFAFGDNDLLGAIVASLLGADLYVILSDIDGLYTANPQTDPGATRISHVSRITPGLSAAAGGAGTAVGTGGMATKVRAARAMLAAGIPMVICKGRAADALVDAAHGKELGTRFEAAAAGGGSGQGGAGSAGQGGAGGSGQAGTHEHARKLWIGLADMPRGTITVDDGARTAILERGASLLPAGITSTSGSYAAGDVVSVFDGEGSLLGRGITRYSSDEVDKIRGLHTSVVARFYPDRADCPCIHRDELLVF